MLIGARVAYLRAHRKLTLKELADRSGCSPSHISFIEKNKRSPTYLMIQSLARGLDVSVHALTCVDYD